MHILRIFAVLVLACGMPFSGVYGQFLQTSPGVFQSPNGSEKLVVSYSKPGIFVITGKALDLQIFNPAHLKKQDHKHVFIEYDVQSTRYSALWIGDKQYKIKGNFTLEMGGARIAVDNNNPYLSIVADKDSNIIGFRGLESVVNMHGEAAVALLEANQFNQPNTAIAPYSWERGQLKLGGAALKRPSLGLNIVPERNPCLAKSRVVYLTTAEVNKLQQSSAEERVKKFDRKLKEQLYRNPLENLLLVRIRKDSIVALDYKDGSVMIIKPLKHKYAEAVVCIANEAQL
ncbi:MAG: hypothetical protein GX589_03400 [Deltaproteobacteria bacterium]|nr:hypothetical protein [Deltaproteobacteria bacterium]